MIMKKTERQIELITRLDELIRSRQTGAPILLAERLEISKDSLFQIIKFMKQLGAPIVFDITAQSYIYYQPINFRFGFNTYNISGEEILEVSSNGAQNYMMPIDFKYPSLRIV